MQEFGYHTFSSVSPERKEKLDEAIAREIFNFSVCFIMDSKVCGSGTLVRVNGKFGILTAAHVVEQFTGYKKRNVGLNISTGIHQFVLFPEAVQHNDFLGPRDKKNVDRGPDISFFRILSAEDESRILSLKNAFLLDGKSFSKFDGFPVKDARWWISGSPKELAAPSATAASVLAATSLSFEGSLSSINKADGFDLIKVGVNAGNYNYPSDYEGVSGGGIWIVRMTMDPNIGLDSIGYEPAFLAGVAFHQQEQDNGTFTITGHGPSSIYDHLSEFSS